MAIISGVMKPEREREKTTLGDKFKKAEHKQTERGILWRIKSLDLGFCVNELDFRSIVMVCVFFIKKKKLWQSWKWHTCGKIKSAHKRTGVTEKRSKRKWARARHEFPFCVKTQYLELILCLDGGDQSHIMRTQRPEQMKRGGSVKRTPD